MTTFWNYLQAELIKIGSLRLTWIGAIVIGLISVFFSFMNVQLHSLEGAMTPEGYQTIDGVTIPTHQLASDALLASPYQTSAVFAPILIALVASTEYQNGQHQITLASCNNRNSLALARLAAYVVVIVAVVVATAVMNLALHKLGLPDEIGSVINLQAFFTVTARVIFVAIVMAIVTIAIVSLTKKGIPSLVVIVGLLVLSMTGILGFIHPSLNNLLPLVGARSFAFGYVEPGKVGITFGIVLLLAWALAATMVQFLAVRRK